MTYPRKSLVSIKETPYYHCVARCVRRAWLWGVDEYADKDYSHRKTWVVDRMSELSTIFAIDICAYAVMSNHYHVVLHVDAAKAREWSDDVVIRQWKRLFAAPTLVQRYANNDAIGEAELRVAQEIVAVWRARLADVSWFMRCLNEHLARRANAEDEVSGRFWEGRFKSQALLDDAGLLTAMAYVDLNPVRAGIARSPESSEFTSIYERVQEMKGNVVDRPKLREFGSEGKRQHVLPYSLDDYVKLLIWTGRAIRDDRPGHIDSSPLPILQHLNIDAIAWMETMRPGGNVFGRAMGQLDHLRLHAKALGQEWIKGLKQAERLYRVA